MFDQYGEFKRQLPDRDPAETQDWVDSLDSIVETGGGKERAQFILYRLLKRARRAQIGLPPLTETRYINTISPEQEPAFPGDEAMELRIRRMVRWNAVAMVLRANNASPGIGGHPAPPRPSCPTSGSSPPCRWASGRGPPSTRPASTATSTPGASRTRARTACGPSSATARRTNLRPWARFTWRPTRASPTGTTR